MPTAGREPLCLAVFAAVGIIVELLVLSGLPVFARHCSMHTLMAARCWR